jgi:hypothetical protein
MLSRSHCQWLVIVSGLLCLTAGAVPAQETKPVCRGVVFLCDGVKDGWAATEGMDRAFVDTGIPWQLRYLRWSTGRTVRDVSDVENHQAMGALLAEKVLAYRAADPNRSFCLVGYSAGCAIVLAAAECLPPGSVDRIILLAPAVSVYYDIRPALRCARCGVTAFCSCEDRVLAAGNALLPPPGPANSAYAGEKGFLYRVCPGEEALYCKLTQTFWDPSMAWTGHRGSHSGWVQPLFLIAYVLPLLG